MITKVTGNVNVRTPDTDPPLSALATGFQKIATNNYEAAGTWFCTGRDTGSPGAWAPGSPGVNGRVTDGSAAADDGCLLVPTPASGSTYLTYLSVSSQAAATVALFDVLWVNTGLTVTTITLQAISSPTLPSRSLDGDTTGMGCWCGIYVTATTGNAGAITNCTLDYTNQAGTARTAAGGTAATNGILATSQAGSVYWFRLQPGDKGVRSVEGITLGTSLVSGSISLIIARPIVMLGCQLANVAAEYKSSGRGIRLFDGTCLLPFGIPTTTTLAHLSGTMCLEVR